MFLIVPFAEPLGCPSALHQDEAETTNDKADLCTSVGEPRLLFPKQKAHDHEAQG